MSNQNTAVSFIDAWWRSLRAEHQLHEDDCGYACAISQQFVLARLSITNYNRSIEAIQHFL